MGSDFDRKDLDALFKKKETQHRMSEDKMFSLIPPIIIILVLILVIILMQGVHNENQRRVSFLYRLSPKAAQVLKIEHAACVDVSSREKALICEKIKDLTRSAIFLDYDVLQDLGIHTEGPMEN